MRNMLVTIYALCICTGLIGLYLLWYPLEPIREIGMWAALFQLATFALFGFIIGVEYQTSEVKTQ